MAFRWPQRFHWKLVAVLALLVTAGSLIVHKITPTFLGTTSSSRAAPHRLDSVQCSKSTNNTLTVRVDTRNDADPSWWPVDMAVYLRLPEARINTLPISNENKKKIKAARKGFIHLCRMRSQVEIEPRTNAAFKPSSIKSAAQILYDYGWSPHLSRGVDPTSYSLGRALDDLGMSGDSDSWFRSTVIHMMPSTGGGTGNYPPTLAVYDNLLNLKDGVLLAASNWSPDATIEKNRLQIPAPKVVPLKRFSDVVWLAREQAIVEYGTTLAREGNTVGKLQHIFRNTILNQETIKVLRMVTGKHSPEELGMWPGLRYPIKEPQGLAALSAPNGYGIAWLLSQHKEATGARMIDRINIFNCPGNRGPQWCIYMHITDIF